MTEAQVVYWLKRALEREGLNGHRVRDILVDRDGSYASSPVAEQLEPMASLRIGDRRPDMLALCDVGRYERVLAFEVKGAHDHEKGVVQAAYYRQASHASYLCIPRVPKPAPDWLLDTARRQGIGLLEASAERLGLVLKPPPPVPTPEAVERTRHFLLGERVLQQVGTLGLNRPLHYAAATVALSYEPDPIKALTSPERWGLGTSAVGHAIRGAALFGLLTSSVKRDASPTPLGRALAQTLFDLGFRLNPSTRRLTAGSVPCLAEAAPAFASTLRMVILSHPLIDVIVRALAESRSLSVRELVPVAARLDDALAAVLFDSTPDEAAGKDWLPRSSTVFQLKRVLHDVGILGAPLARGASNLRSGEYSPDEDIWVLGAMKPPLADLA